MFLAQQGARDSMGGVKIRYPRRLKLAQLPTPIEEMPRLTELFGGPQIFFKRDDLTGSTLSGNKIRKLEFSLAEALKKKARVVITAGGVQSNHCRATALCCARLGLECHLILRGAQEGPPDGNLLLDSLAGARFSFFPREVYSTQKPEIVARLTKQYAKEKKKAYWIPVGASNAIGSWGYVRAFEEIVAQNQKFGLGITHIVVAIGSGGTMAGLVAGHELSGGSGPKVVGINVCDDAELFRAEIRGIFDEMNTRFKLSLPVENAELDIRDGYVGAGYAISYPEEIELIKQVGKLEGQVLDPVYTGKALYGLSREIQSGRFKPDDRILFIHTGGVFGIFPQCAEFGFLTELPGNA